MKNKEEQNQKEAEEILTDLNTCKICKTLRYTNPYADSYECTKCGKIYPVKKVITDRGRVITKLLNKIELEIHNERIEEETRDRIEEAMTCMKVD